MTLKVSFYDYIIKTLFLIAEEWDEKRKAHGQSEDLLKQRQRQADLEKQRKLEAFKVQAAQPHEQKHLEVREQRLKEKMREAEEQKQRSLETFDRLARKEDVTQQSSVHTEVRGRVGTSVCFLHSNHAVAQW